MSNNVNEEEDDEEIEISFDNLKQVIKKDFRDVDEECKFLVKNIQEDINTTIAYGPRREWVTAENQHTNVTEDVEGSDQDREAIHFIAASIAKMHKKAQIDLQVIQLYDEYEVKNTLRSDHISTYFNLVLERILDDFRRVNQNTEIAVDAIKSNFTESVEERTNPLGNVFDDVQDKVNRTREMIKEHVNVFSNPIAEMTPEEKMSQEIVESQLSELAKKAKADFDAAKEITRRKTEKTKQGIKENVTRAKETIQNSIAPSSSFSIREALSEIKANQITKFNETNEDVQMKVKTVKDKVNKNFDEIYKEVDENVRQFYNLPMENVTLDVGNIKEKASTHFGDVDDKIHKNVVEIKSRNISNRSRTQFAEIDEKIQKDVSDVKKAISDMTKVFTVFLPKKKEEQD